MEKENFQATVPSSRRALEKPPQEKENQLRASNRKVSDGGLESLSPKFRAAILGATGSVGQRFVSLLINHPWIEIVALGASEKSAGRPYKEACRWRLENTNVPEDIKNMKVLDAVKDKHVFINECDIIFSALSVDVATPLELEYAKAGLAVFSNSAAFRYSKFVPILIPQVNPKHLELVYEQTTYTSGGGFVVCNSNCTTAGISVALQPLHQAFGIKKVVVASLQACSGAGYPGLSFWDIHGNVIPYIKGEEEKVEVELRKILGHMTGDTPGAHIEPAEILVSAMCHRVPVLNGHTISLSIKLAKPLEKSKVVQEVQKVYTNHIQQEKRHLPSLSAPSICLLEGEDEPQPALHATDARGMTVFIGRIRPCEVFDVKLVTLSHNTILGAAGGSIANAELAISTGLLR